MFTLTSERIEEIKTAFEKKVWGSSVCFLDSINDIDELEAITEYLRANKPHELNLLQSYDKWLRKWPNAKEIVMEQLKNDFPLLTSKVVDDESARVLLRAAEFAGSDLTFFAKVVENDILRPHLTDGKNILRWPYLHNDSHHWADYPHNRRCFVISTIAYYTQLQMWRFGIVFIDGNGRRASGGGGTNGVYIDWCSKEERIAAGERVFEP